MQEQSNQIINTYDIRFKRLFDLPFWAIVNANTQVINDCHPNFLLLKDQLKLLIRFVRKERIVAINHSTKDISNRHLPLLFDDFCGFFEPSPDSQPLSYPHIKSKLKQLGVQPKMKKVLAKYPINISLQYRLYLLISISQQISLSQDTTSFKVDSPIINIWQTALTDCLKKLQKTTEKDKFVGWVLQKLYSQTLNNLEFNVHNQSKLSNTNTLNISVQKADHERLIRLIRNHPYVTQCLIKLNAFATIIQLFFKDQSTLKIHLMALVNHQKEHSEQHSLVNFK